MTRVDSPLDRTELCSSDDRHPRDSTEMECGRLEAGRAWQARVRGERGAGRGMGGGVAAVAEITGLARSRIIRGLKDLDGPALEPGRIRRAGGGRHRVTATDSTLLGELKRLVEPATMGDPMRQLTWVSKIRPSWLVGS